MVRPLKVDLCLCLCTMGWFLDTIFGYWSCLYFILDNRIYRTSPYNSPTRFVYQGMDYQGDTAGGGGGGGFYTGGGGYGSQGRDSYGSQGVGRSTSGGGGARRNYDEQTYIPVTIRMVYGATPDPTTGDGSLTLLDGRKVSTIILVAAVRSFTDQSTNILYQVEDGTGLLDVKHWLDDNEGSTMAELREQTLKENIYLKIIGQIKDYEGKKMVVANSIRPLTTGNELTHHMLQVTYSAEKFKRADSIVAPPSRIGSSGIGFGSHNPGHSSMMTSGRSTGMGNALKDLVMDFIRLEGEMSERGADIRKCIQQLKLQNHSESDIRRVVEDLSGEGHIYSTIDDDHYNYAQ